MLALLVVCTYVLVFSNYSKFHYIRLFAAMLMVISPMLWDTIFSSFVESLLFLLAVTMLVVIDGFPLFGPPPPGNTVTVFKKGTI